MSEAKIIYKKAVVYIKPFIVPNSDVKVNCVIMQCLAGEFEKNTVLDGQRAESIGLIVGKVYLINELKKIGGLSPGGVVYIKLMELTTNEDIVKVCKEVDAALYSSTEKTDPDLNETKIKYGFKLSGVNSLPYEKIDDVSDRLYKEGFINGFSSEGKRLNKSDFRNIFSDKCITKKILWTGTETDLSYFIKTLKKLKKITSREGNWDATKNCFIVKDSLKEIEGRRFSALKKPYKDKKVALDKIANFL